MATAAPALPSAPPAAAPSAAPLPPGPGGAPSLTMLAWALAPTWLMDRCAARYGPTFTLRLGGLREMVMVSDPQDIKAVFTAPPELAPSAAASTPVAPIMGASSVITLTGAEHLRQRRLLLPPFHGERMRAYNDTIVQATRRELATWPLGRPMALAERTRAITLEVILRAVFGVEAQRMDALRDAIAGLLAPMRLPALVRLALTERNLRRPTGAIGRALDHLDAVIYDELHRRRAQSDLHERSDILSLLLLARDEDGQAMTDGELRDELVTLLLAGHETTATSVAWAVERLVRHPDKLARLTAEIDAGAGEESGAGDEYMQAVIAETLRLRPVVPIVIRVLEAPMRLGGHELPAHTRVVPSIHLANRNPRVYDAPREFRPERFLDSPPDTFSWIPFGGGIRRCIGASFATLEMKLILATVLSELQPRLPPRTHLFRRGEWPRRRAITLVPAAGARVVWTRRS
ncbi:MAG TPA: cytochrome P450 [Solirubrobacteraceae bacterium]